MIDIEELRRLAQAATPHVGHACKYQDAHWLREGHVDFENADLFIASERPQEDAAFYAAANPAAISELLDRLEATEKERGELLAGLDEWLDKTKWVQQGINEGMISAKYLGLHRADVMTSLLGEAEKERDALRAKIAEMEKQEPVAIQHRVPSVDFRGECVGYSEWRDGKGLEYWPHRTLYLAPGAQTQGEEK